MPVGRRSIPTVGMGTLLLVSSLLGRAAAQSAEPAAEPIFLSYHGPARCTPAPDLLRRIGARGARVRKAEVGDAARVFDLSIEERPGSAHGYFDSRNLDGT